MRKGDMELKVVEKGKHRTIPIKEGEVDIFCEVNKVVVIDW